MKVLFLSAWYPHRYDAMAGLFVRKHALAVSQYAEVCVLYMQPDENISEIEVTEETVGNVHEVVVYHPFCPNALLKKVSKAVGFCRAFAQGFEAVKQHYGLPDVTHVNVLTRCGVLAWWLEKKYHIPYVVTEHWSRYLPQNFSYTGFLRKALTKRVLSKAHAVMPVCENLAKAMQRCGLQHGNYQVVPNVVDDCFFQTTHRVHVAGERFTLLHVSCFDEKSKNVLGTLRAFRQLIEVRKDVTFQMVGTGTGFEAARDLAEQLMFPADTISFTGELPPEEVCKAMSQADALVLFSNYENAPVVVSEALAMGVPVVASRVGGIPEMVVEGSGVLVEPGDEAALVEGMNRLLDNYNDYAPTTIQQHGLRYQFNTVGNTLYYIYREAIKKQRHK